MDTLQLKNVVKSLKKTELVFQLNDGRLRIGKADIRWETIDNNGTPDERIIITPEIQERDYRVNFSSPTLDKQGASNAKELVDFWEANNFFFDIASQPIADGRVEFRADLPVTIGFPAVGAIFVVEKPTTILLGLYTTFQSGWYIKDNDTGSLNDWRRLNKKFKYTADEFAIVDPTDQSKQGQFDASSITTDTIRTYVIPDKNGTIALISDINGGLVGWIDDGGIVRLTNSNDSVGIGIDIPLSKLHVKWIDDSDGVIFDNSGRTLKFSNEGIGLPWIIAISDNKPLDFSLGGSARFRMDENGNMGNVTIPLDVFYVEGEGKGFGGSSDGSIARWVLQTTASGAVYKTITPSSLELGTNNITRMTIDADGNITVNRKFLAKDFNRNTVYFTNEADLPAPSGGVITLQENTTYILFNDDPTTSQKIVTLTNRIAIPDNGGVRITSSGLATVILNYSGTGNFITTTSNFTGFIHLDEIFMSAPNGTIFDIDGVLPIGSEFFPRLFLSNMAFFNTKNLGTIKNISYNQAVCAVFDCKQGIVFDHCEEVLISDVRFTDWQNDVGSVFVTFKNALRFPKISNCIFETQSNETIFDISPSIPSDDILEVTTCIFRGIGTNFKTGTSGTIISISDNSDSGNTITGTSGTAFGETIFTTNVAHNYVQGQIVILSTFSTNTQYNGTFEILEIISPTQFRIHVAFGTNESGDVDSTIIEIESTAHGLSVGDGVQLITNNITLGYNTGYLVIISSANFFSVNATFTSTDIGAWNTNSLTQKDKRTLFSGNSGLPDSSVSTELKLSGNTAITDIPAVGAMVEINVNQDWIATDIERLVVNANGSVTLDVDKDAKLKIDANINIEPVTATKSISIKTVLITPPPIIVTFTNATNIINETATNVINGDVISFRDNFGILPSEIRKDVVYFVINKNANDFQISYTLGGAAITFTDDGTPTNSYQIGEIHGSTPTNTIQSGSPRELIPQATVPSTLDADSFLVVINNDDSVNIQVNSGYQRYFE